MPDCQNFFIFIYLFLFALKYIYFYYSFFEFKVVIKRKKMQTNLREYSDTKRTTFFYFYLFIMGTSSHHSVIMFYYLQPLRDLRVELVKLAAGPALSVDRNHAKQTHHYANKSQVHPATHT